MLMLKATPALLLLAGQAYTYVLSDIQEPIRAPYAGLASHDKLSEVISSSPLLSLHRAICEIESVSNHELPVAKLIISFLEAHNFTVQTQSVPLQDTTTDTDTTRARWNIYAYPDPLKYGGSESETSHPSPKVLLTSHIDTVPPHIPYSLSLPGKADNDILLASRKDILVSGRGTVDDKACVAVQIQTILDLLADPSTKVHPSNVALLLVVGEENSGDGMKHFSDSELFQKTNTNYKAVLFGEPTEGKLATGHKGVFGLRVNAYGKAAHSGYPWLGRSATSMILPTLLTLDGLGDLPVSEGGLPRSEKFGKSTINVGYIRGGVAGNVVPEFATADVTFRIAAGEKEEIEQIVRKAIRATDPEDLLDLKFSLGYGPISLDADVEGFETITVNYGTDIPNLELAPEVKRYLYGPGSILVAHGRDEGLTVGDLEEALDGYKRLVHHALKL
ncbi:hypothetical protein LTR84_007675 [Exophiala bonariae]|uniref:Peptidase M20 dimerisation domain-containing protein n=1 Tax=Exophiala bonariae TaxID=1690606 RepID=A0AAV9NLS8_9EURO|nr:hypothetical protein LTR84_007675 [Exophiala bonariae]